MFPRAVSRAVNGRGALTSLRPTPTYSILTQHIHSRQAAPRWERLRTFGSLSGTWRQSVARNPQLFSSFLNLQHLRSASSNADRPTKAKGQNPNQGDVTKEDAESPWTEEPRSPAPGGGALGDNAEESSAPKYRSKLGTESETAEEVDSVTGKLPDLRYGIPSNFNAETSQTSDTSSSFKTEETPSRDLDITADPASGGGRGEEASPKEAYVSSIDRRRQALARWMYTAAAAFGLAAFAWLGRDWDSEAEANTHPDAPNGLSPIAWYYRFRERLGGQFSHYTEPAFPKLLPDPPSDPNQRMPYTLVLSLEDLLVTSTWTRQDGYKIAKRPGVDYFLRYLCQYYELVIFTTVQVANGDLVLRQLDPYQLCLPIFRDGTRYMNGEHVKDLSYLNRDLSKTILIDTRAEHARLQPENAIILPKWTGKREDAHSKDLVALIPFLEYIAGMELSDVRKVLASYKDKDIPAEFHRREALAREEFSKRYNAEKGRRKHGAGALSGLSSALGFKSSNAMMQIPGEQSPAEALAEGKMLSDLMRERGHANYLALEKQIKENGESWLKARAEEEKKAQEEGMRNMTSGMFGMFGGAGEKK